MFGKLKKYLSGKSKSWIMSVSIALVLLTGCIDYLIGKEVSLSVVYLIPVVFVAWYIGARHAFFIAFLAAVAWLFFAEILAGVEYNHIIIAIWNTVAMLTFFFIAAYLFAYLRRERTYLEEEVQKQTKALLDVQKRLSESEKLALLGQLSTGIVHEINNPLFAVYSRLELIGEGRLSAKQKKNLALAVEGIDIIKSITKDLLNIATVNKLELYSVDIIELIKEVIVFLRPHFDYEKITVSLKPGDTSLLIRADKDRIKQIFINILLNAIQSISTDGKIEISVWAENDLVMISVRDNGIGIASDRIAHIFEPFVSWGQPKKEKGVGLGLFVVANIISAHKGDIRVESRPGQGTTFTIILPRG